MSFVALLLAPFPAYPPQVPVQNEIAVLETDIDPYGLAYVNGLALEGDWLAAGGADVNGFESQLLFHDAPAWTPVIVPVGGGFVDLDGERFATSAAENHQTTVLRRKGATWEVEARLSEDFSSLHGDWLLTHRTPRGIADTVDAWRLVNAAWQRAGALMPATPQVDGSCCYPIRLWADTAAFRARGASGDDAVHVFRQSGGQWLQEAELVPAEFLGTGRGSLGEIQGSGQTIAALYAEGAVATAFVWERENGTWHERARISHGGELWSLALEGDTLVLGLGPPESVALVYERSQGSWRPSARLETSSGQGIGRALALAGRRVVCSTVEYYPPSESRIFVFELPPYPRLTTYGCGLNPEGSLVVLAGAPTAGGSVRIGLDNPLGSQASGSLALLGMSARPDVHFPCGTRVPRTGMARGPGELLVASDALVHTVGTWRGPGLPAETDIAIPADLTLVGRRLFVQGALLDLRARARVPLGLTEALELEVGPP